MQLILYTFIINNVHCSSVRHSSGNPHCLHFWGHCQFSSEALITLSGAIVDCAVLHCGHATAYLKNGTPLSTLVVSGAYTGDGCISTYTVSIQEMSTQETAVFWMYTMACDSSYIQKMYNTWNGIKYWDRFVSQLCELIGYSLAYAKGIPRLRRTCQMDYIRMEKVNSMYIHKW